MYATVAQFVFYLFCTFFQCYSDSNCMPALGSTSNPCNSFFMLFIHLTLLLCSFCFHDLLQKYFISFVFGYSFVFMLSPSILRWQNFLSLFSKILFLLFCLIDLFPPIVRFVCCCLFSVFQSLFPYVFFFRQYFHLFLFLYLFLLLQLWYPSELFSEDTNFVIAQFCLHHK